MTRVSAVVFTLAVVVLGPSSWVEAQEYRQVTESPEVVQETVTPQVYYRVYAGNCSRSMKFQGNHLSFATAISAKRLLDDRGYLRTEISSTNILRGEDLWDDSLNIEISYRVFRPTKKGWQLSASFENRTEMGQFIAEVLKEQNPTHQIVEHFTFSLK